MKKKVKAKIKRKKMVYRIRGKYGGGFMFWVIPKGKAPYGKDDIQMMWSNSQEAKEGRSHKVYLQDWEALVLIQGLTYALLEKTGTKLKEKSGGKVK
jgi:hypothetical protein